MLTKYQPHFASLTPAHAAHVAAAVARRHRLAEAPDAESGEELWELCEALGLDQADVVLSLAADATPMGVVCIETLIGRPITRELPASARAPRAPRAPKGAAVRRADSRRILTVVPNPKKPGSKSHARFEAYRVGMTVDQAVAAGLTMDDIRHDVARGFITLED